MTAIFTSANDFTTYTATVPASIDPPTALVDTGAIVITKSDNTNVTVFDSLETALKCLDYMNTNSLYYMLCDDGDLTILNLNMKLLIFENTFINQKLLNTYVLTYHSNAVTAIHRNLSKMFSLKDALINSGYKTELATFNTNSDWQALTVNKRPYMLVVDWYYFENSSKLVDATQMY